MTAVNINVRFKPAKWPENLKNSRAGKLMMWRVGWVAAQPDGDTFLALGNASEHRAKRITRASIFRPTTSFMRSRSMLPDGPEREALFLEAKKLFVAYTPYKFVGHRIETAVFHPWVIGYRRHSFMRAMWKYIDIDQRRKGRARRMTSDQPAIRTQNARRTSVCGVLQQHKHQHRTVRKSCVMRLRWQKPVLIPSPSPIFIRASSRRTSSTDFIATTTWRGLSRYGPARPTACRRSRRTFASGPFG